MTHQVTVERELDVRAMPAEAAAGQALSRFDLLDPGERFVLVGRDAGATTLSRLQSERPRAFEWSPLLSGPPVWRTEIARREAASREPRGVNEALSWDHDRLEALESAAFLARSAGDLQAAFDLFAEFALGLRRHIGFEENLLFPAFEARTGMSATAGPTAVMRAEHREIETLLEQIASGIGDAAGEVDVLRANLHAVLGDHNVKEEQVLYPSSDQLLGAEGADRLVSEIQRYGS